MKSLKHLFFLLAVSSYSYANAGSVIGFTTEGLDYSAIQSKIQNYKIKNEQQKTDFSSVKNEMLSCSEFDIVSIPIAEKIIEKSIVTMNPVEQDSTYIIFNYIFYTAVNAFNDSLELKYPDILEKFEKGTTDQKTREFKKCLDLCGLSLLNSEGSYYVDEKDDYYYDLFKGKVSPALNEYLKIRNKEIKQGYSEDADLLIGFDDLYERVVTWEDFMAQYPDFFLLKDAEFNYTSYLSTLITGTDNSETFDSETQNLYPGIKKLYEKIISHKDGKKSTKVISDYYELLKRNEFKQPDNLDLFLKANNLISMVGVQPETR